MTTTGEGRWPTARGAGGQEPAAPEWSAPPSPAEEPPVNGRGLAAPPDSRPAVVNGHPADSPPADRPASHRRPEPPDTGPPDPAPPDAGQPLPGPPAPSRRYGRHAAPDPADGASGPLPPSLPESPPPPATGSPPRNGYPGRPGPTGSPAVDDGPAPGRYPGAGLYRPLDRLRDRPPDPPSAPRAGPPWPPVVLDGPTEVFSRPVDLRPGPLPPAASAPAPPHPVRHTGPPRRPGSGAPAEPDGSFRYPPPPRADPAARQSAPGYVPEHPAGAPDAPYPVPVADPDAGPPGSPAPTRETDAPALPHPGRAAIRRKRRRRRLLEWPFLVVFSLLAALLLRTFVVQTFFIPSESMHDTLVEGDRVLVNKLAYHFHDLRRGDVVVFRRPANIDIADDDLIKRVIGLPGERVEGHDRHVYINGRQLEEPYLQRRCGGTADFPPVTVPAGHAFVMGDNRCDSTDSRVFGPIDTGLVVGRAFVIIWPFGRIGWL